MDHQERRGEFSIDIERAQLAVHGVLALENIMAQFCAFAETYAKENSIKPEQVTVVNFLNYLKNPQ